MLKTAEQREYQRQVLINLLRDQKLTVGFAESCTGGQLSGFLAEQAGVSDIFLGSVVSYANEVKVGLLGVRRDTLMNEGAVSEQTALQMAQGVRKQIQCDWSAAITGIAGPTGGSATKPVGTVCFAIAGPSFEKTFTQVFQGSRTEVQQQSVDYAVQILIDGINNQ
ncbi:MAG: CinA family protein [Bdellovibrionia bacterium]